MPGRFLLVGMAKSIHPRMEGVDAAMDLLLVAARETSLRVASKLRDRKAFSYRTLQPGPHTPLWNELCDRVAAQLRRRGDQAVLARFLGVPRQRLHRLVKARTSAPDAERTLLLLSSVVAREQGRDLR